MNIVDAIQSKPEIIKRKLNNNLIEVKTFYDGQICEHYFEDENGERHGECKGWCVDGTLWEHCYYEHGKRHGEYKGWWSDGILSVHSYYEHGERHGEYKGWCDEGTLSEQYYYEHGKLVEDYLKEK